MPTRTILIIEDERNQRELLRDALGADGFRVIAVDDAAEALALSADVTVDLILLDLVMPRARMDGFAFLSKIRGRPDLAHTPLVIVSGIGDTVTDAIDGATASALRIACVIRKPYAIDDLIQEIRRILGDGAAAGSSDAL